MRVTGSERALDGRPALAWPQIAEHAAVAIAAGTWLLLLTPSSGGFHDYRTAWLAAALAVALLLTRPWLHVPTSLLVLVGACGIGAALVLMHSPEGWAQADSPAAQLVGLVALLVAAAYSRTAARRRAVCSVVLLALLLQFAEAWLPWWGSGDPNHLMIGTFYWHNQLAAWMLGTGLLAGAVAVSGPPDLRLPAMLSMPFADVAVLLSTSRSTFALLVLGQLVVLALACTVSDRMRSLLRGVLMPVLAAGLLVFLTGSLFFPHASYHGAPALGASTPAAEGLPGVGARDVSSLAQHSSDRVEWSKAALRTWRDEPVWGSGFGSFLLTSDQVLPAEVARSTFVHNGFAEALTSGGLVFGLPLLLVAVVVVWRAARSLWAALRGRHGDGCAAAAGLGAAALVAHTAVDFDWHYASLVVLFGVLGGLLFGDPAHVARTRGRIAWTGICCLTVVLAAAASLVEHHGRDALARLAPPAQRVSALLAAPVGSLYDARLTEAAVTAALAHPAAGPDRLAVSPQLARAAVDASRRGAALNPREQAERAELLALLNEPQQARHLAEELVDRYGDHDPWLYVPYAQVMQLTRSTTPWRQRVAATSARSPAADAWQLVSVLQRLDGATVTNETRCAYADAARRVGPPPPDVHAPEGTCQPAT